MAKTIGRDTFMELEQTFDEVRDDYSGRGMFGKKCVAIVTDESGWFLRGELQEMIEELDENDSEEFLIIEDIKKLLDHEPRQDSMGLSKVYYWSNIEVGED